MEKIKKKYSKTDCLILGIGFLILGLFVLSIAIPIVYVVLASFMDPTVLNNIAGSVSIVQEGICGKKIFQSHFPDYNVLWRWNDPDFYFNQSAAYGKYSLGSFDSWSI